jgi:hypothetical protein
MTQSADIRGQVTVATGGSGAMGGALARPTMPLCSGSQHTCRPELQNGELIVNYW